MTGLGLTYAFPEIKWGSNIPLIHNWCLKVLIEKWSQHLSKGLKGRFNGRTSQWCQENFDLSAVFILFITLRAFIFSIKAGASAVWRLSVLQFNVVDIFPALVIIEPIWNFCKFSFGSLKRPDGTKLDKQTKTTFICFPFLCVHLLPSVYAPFRTKSGVWLSCKER